MTAIQVMSEIMIHACPNQDLDSLYLFSSLAYRRTSSELFDHPLRLILISRRDSRMWAFHKGNSGIPSLYPSNAVNTPNEIGHF